MGEANSDLGSALDSGKSALGVELRARVAELTATITELTAKVAKLTATNAELRAQVAELEARLGAPPKTPANSSLPPSRGAKANKPVRGGKRKRKGRAGTGRKLHPHPNSVVEARAESCPHCGTEQETAGLKQRNQDLLRSPFGKRSEKRQSGSEAGAAAAETVRPGADSEPQRPRGGQRGAVPHARVERSGLAVQQEWLEPEAERRYCADCGAPYARNGEESSASIEVEVRGYVRRIRRPRFRAGCGCAQRQGQPVPAVVWRRRAR